MPILRRLLYAAGLALLAAVLPDAGFSQEPATPRVSTEDIDRWSSACDCSGTRPDGAAAETATVSVSGSSPT